MQNCKYLYANEKKKFFIKLEGKLSYISCAGFKSFTDKILSENLADEIYFDLTQTTSIDSTNLGILAKCALFFLNKKKNKPILFSTNNDVNTVLTKNSFHTIFDIITDDKIPSKNMNEVFAERFDNKEGLNNIILETHEALSRISDSNKLKYKDVLQLLRFKKI